MAATAALGGFCILWVIAIEAAVLLVAVLLGLGIGIFKGWVVGAVVGIFSYAIINKVLWYLEIFDMISAGSRKKKPCPPEKPSNTQ